jgi:hypothetical protein
VFSVDDLLGKLAEQNAQEMDETQKRALLVDLAEIAEQQSALRGDAGNILVREVQTYLNSKEAAAMFAFEALVQQLGDMCLDHMHSGEIGSTGSTTNTMSLGGDAHDMHEHATHQNQALRKAKTKSKKKPPTLFEYFIKRRRSQADKKRLAILALCP